MVELAVFQRLGLAIAIGFLIGLERGWKTRDEHGGERQAGIRTFTLIGFLGGLAGLLGEVGGDATTVVIGLGIGALIIVGYVVGAQKPEDDRGMTTEVAAFITFVLGAMAVRGDMIVAAASSVVLVAILDLKHYLHQWVARIQAVELGSFITLLVISIVLLPVVPNQGFGPGGVLNPYELWWVVVLITAASFAGYIAIKIIGAGGGTLLMGVMGGVASSTALTVSASRLAAQSKGLTAPLAGAIAAASAVMFARILFIASAIAPALGRELLPPFVAAGLVCAAFAWLQSQETERDNKPADLQLGPPTDIRLAIQFALLLGAFALAVHYTRELLSDEWVIALAAISGLVDVDATTVTMARGVSGHGETIPLRLAFTAVLVAVAVNMAVKAGITRGIGGHDLFVRTLTMTAAAAGVAMIVAGIGLFL
jgi:uncharacterized membrane protein (DUF4010 family)